MQPAAELALRPGRAGLPGQDEEGRLEGVLGVVRIAEDAPADGQDHRPVSRDQGREGRLVAPGGEAGEQLGIGEARGTPLGEQPLNLPQSGPQLRPAMIGFSFGFVAL